MVEGEVNFRSFIGGLGKAFLSAVNLETLDAAPSRRSVFVDVPADLRDHHPGADRRRLRRAHEVLAPCCCSWCCGSRSSIPPIAHMVWSGRSAALMCGLGRARLRRRHGGAHQRRHRRPGRRPGARQAQGLSGTTAMPPHNLALTMIGASLLWVGWFGFNAGSALERTAVRRHGHARTRCSRPPPRRSPGCSRSGSSHGKPTDARHRLGRGRRPGRDHAGLRALVGPMGALVDRRRGRRVLLLRRRPGSSALGYDDSLDVFGVHCDRRHRRRDPDRRVRRPRARRRCRTRATTTIGAQLWIQTKGVLFTVVFTGVVGASCCSRWSTF